MFTQTEVTLNIMVLSLETGQGVNRRFTVGELPVACSRMISSPSTKDLNGGNPVSVFFSKGSTLGNWE